MRVMKKKMTKRQFKAWRKRRQHVNARRKMANYAHNQTKRHGVIDENSTLSMNLNRAGNRSLMMSIASAVSNMVNMLRRSGDR